MEKPKTHLRIFDAFYQNQAPQDSQGLDRVGKGVCLKSPSNIRRCNEKKSIAALAWLIGFVIEVDELVKGPVFKHKACKEHQEPQRPEDNNRGDVAILPISNPKPTQQKHREPIDGPEGEDTPNRVLASEFPCMPNRVTKDLAYIDRISGLAII
jgi:hypothetical protein